ncbi:hypothetical protein PENTCL1PPCAC_30337 [Pristionchus entomophagus]|uniref:SLC26A/SulP transporter domain-containing protein n=1 Tax=Pristionchus entomophagus TaxID=358040 RepID=A0AAV5UNC5_9BILA|nr:hypothetical protein PENTCL1PPCAC_30337 [Pristionchus entomophagus]
MNKNVVQSNPLSKTGGTLPLSSKEVTATPFSLAEDRTQPCSPKGVENELSKPTLYVEANKSQYVEKVVMDQEKFDKRFGYRRINISLGRKMYYHFNKIRRWGKYEWLDFTRDCIPILRWLPEYRREWLCTDIFGGLMVSILSVPQGLAYGYLAGVPAIHGLYTSIYLSFLYVVFGSSKHAAPGAFAIIAMMVGTVVEDVLTVHDVVPEKEIPGFCCSPKGGGGNNTGEALDVVMSVTMLVGVWQIIFGLLNAGILAVWLSEYLVKGLMGGAAIHVVTSQIKSMTGLKNLPGTSEPFGLITFYSCLIKQVTHINLPVLIISTVSVAFLLISAYVFDPILKKWCSKFKFPMELLLVVYGTVGMKLLDNTRWTLAEKVPVVGEVPFGLYSPRIPSMKHITSMLGHSMSIAIISFAIHIALAKLIAKQMQYQVNSNQEWFALGAMHFVSSFFGCFAGGSSLGRSLMQVKFGTHSQISTLVAAFMLVIVVFGASKLIVTLPNAVLAAIVRYRIERPYSNHLPQYSAD